MDRIVKLAEKNKPAFEIIDVEQNSPEWMQARIGLPTASNFSVIMASGKDGGESVGRKKLMYRLAGEILTGEPGETYKNSSMDRGSEMEAEARSHYERTRLTDVQQVGFVRRKLASGRYVGCSPDGLVGDRKVLELKTMKPELLIEWALKGAAGFPTEHRQQCQGALWLTERDECDLMIFYRGMPVAPCFKIERDDIFIRQIDEQVQIFDHELHRLVEKLRAMGGVS